MTKYKNNNNSKKIENKDTKLSQERMKKLKATIENARIEWKDDSNVMAIGFGAKHRKNEITDEPSITFHVRRKLASESAIIAIGSKPIPKTIDGFPTDVKLFNAVRSSSPGTGERDEKRFDPLVGGIMTSNAENNIWVFNDAGTLGTLCFRGNTPFALSNWHVWADGGERGDDIIQPGHPRLREHFEGLGKVIFCGPLVGSLFEWEAPSPLTWALYGGAAAAAIAAAASDDIDPIRRGQKETPTQRGEKTIGEQVDMEIKYVEQPLTGTSYKVEVDWKYKRNTDRRIHTHSVQETRINPHNLTFKQLGSDNTEYAPGSRVKIFASIGSSHSRPCDSYYVVAHYIPDKDPSRLISLVLKPVSCTPDPDLDPDPHINNDTVNCIDFSKEKIGTNLDRVFQRKKVRFTNSLINQKNTIVDLNSDGNGELLLSNDLIVSVPPCRRIEVTLASATPELIMNAYHAGKIVGSARTDQAENRTLVIDSNVIDQVVFISSKIDNLSSIVKLCYIPNIIQHNKDNKISTISINNKDEICNIVCCYEGYMDIPNNEEASSWKGYLIVQNINDTPQGMQPEKAAETIGGIISSQNLTAKSSGCGAIMMADHVFNVI